MNLIRPFVAASIAFGLSSPALAQDKPTVSGLLGQGYQIIQSEIGNPFIQFLLKNDTVVWCSVQLQTGETSSCRTIK